VLILEIIGGLLILVVLVVVHELGHALVARRNGVVVEEFGIGFPPKAWAKKLKNGVLFSLNWLPVGGFVKLQGEQDAANKKGDYGAATLWQKTKILFAGVVINWLVAVVLLTILAITGLPKIIPDQFSVASDTKTVTSTLMLGTIVKDSPAEKAGFESGDRLYSVDGDSVTSTADFIAATKAHSGEKVAIEYQSVGEDAIEKREVTLRDASAGAVFGASLGQQEFIKATWSAPVVGVVTTAQLTWVTLQGLGNLFANLATGVVLQFSSDDATQKQAKENLAEVGDSVAGPVGILGTIFPEAERAGLTQLVFLTAIISLTLAVMNTLPIPALDGGRWFVTVLFRLIRKPLTKEIEERIQATGFIILMGLILLITIGDVSKLL